MIKNENNLKFLETITAIGNNALVPIANIEYINMRVNGSGYEIVIKGKANFCWEEHFTDEAKAHKRYEMIKKIIGAE